MANPRPEPQRARNPASFAAAIKAQFRQLASAIMPHTQTPAPAPQRRRSSSEDTGQAAFRMAARKIMRRVGRLPAEAYAAASAYLFDTLDWMNPWHHEPDPQDCPEADETATPQGYLYPHL